MLEALGRVDWKSLGHAYGAADDVPQQIRDLRSDDEETRGEASRELFSNIFHQGSRFEASAYAVPFLVEVAAAPDTRDRPIVLSQIGALAIGYDGAATALARLTPGELPAAAVDELRLTSRGVEPDLGVERFPFFEGDLPGYAAATLVYIARP